MVLITTQSAAWARAQGLPEPWLTPAEQARCDALPSLARQREFVACRQALRQVLASGGDLPAASWRLEAPPGQAPRLDPQHHGAGLAAATRLSLSHSGPYLACVARPHAVGVDLEVKGLDAVTRDTLAAAALVCSAAEIVQLQAVAGVVSRYRSFLQLWCLKEAAFKCGHFGVALSRIACCPAPEGDAQAVANARTWVGATSLGHIAVLAVCVPRGQGPPSEVVVDADISWQAASGRSWLVT